MIDINLVKCFLTIVEEKSFSQAALRLGTAQSAISQKLQRLEDVLQLSLLQRTSRPGNLSVEGQAFLPYAQAMIKAERDARAAALDIRERSCGAGTLIVGAYNFQL